MKNRLIVSLAVLLLCYLMMAGVALAQLAIDDLRVIDVTTSSFSVAWRSSLPAVPSVHVFSDAGGLTEITSAVEVEAYPFVAGDPTLVGQYLKDEDKAALALTMNDLGLARLRVGSLDPDTTYYFRVVSSTETETVESPSLPDGPLSVKTSLANTFISASNQVVVTIDHSAPKGWVVTASTADAVYPVSGVVGDGAAPNKAHLNLANLFNAGGHNLEPAGITTVTFWVSNGTDPSVEHNFDISFPSGFSVSTVHVVDIVPFAEPTITLVEPFEETYAGAHEVIIRWVDQAAGVNANIALYYDTDNTGTDGTLIATAIPEDPDAAGDVYAWDTTAVSDGIYYVYGIMDAAGTLVTSYAPGPVAVDRGVADSDADTMADLWEQLFFQSLTRDGSGDFDDDGLMDSGEFGDLTNPNIPDVRLSLRAGLNFVSLPVNLDPPQNSYDFAAELGPSLLSMSRLDATSQTMQTTEVTGGVASGDNFPVGYGGYYLMLSSDTDIVVRGTAVGTPAQDLASGQNLVGFKGVQESYTAYQLLADLGGEGVGTSVQRYNLETGQIETAGYHGVSPVGPNFGIRRGESYVINTLTNVSGFLPPP